MVRIAHATSLRVSYRPRRRQGKPRPRFMKLFATPIHHDDPMLNYGHRGTISEFGRLDTLKGSLLERTGLIDLEKSREPPSEEDKPLSVKPFVYQLAEEVRLPPRSVRSARGEKREEPVGATAAAWFALSTPLHPDAGWVELSSRLRWQQSAKPEQGTVLLEPACWASVESEVGSELIGAEFRFKYEPRERYKATAGSALPPVDWDRWDELRNKRRFGGLTADEDREYERSARVVAVLDALEAARAERAVEGLLEKHKRVVASLDRLAKAVRTAAEQL